MCAFSSQEGVLKRLAGLQKPFKYVGESER